MTKPSSLNGLRCRLADEEWNSLPLHIEPVSLPQHVLLEFPRVGTILRVLVDEKYESFGFHFQHGGKWLRLRNLMCKTESGLWKGIFTLETKFRLLSEQIKVSAFTWFLLPQMSCESRVGESFMDQELCLLGSVMIYYVNKVGCLLGLNVLAAKFICSYHFQFFRVTKV